MIGRHPRALAMFVIAALGIAGAVFRLSPMWPGPSLPAGATRLTISTEPAHLVPALACPAALLAPATIVVDGDRLVLVPVGAGEPVRVVWPSGWAAWRLKGRAELVDRDGSVVGHEGQVIEGFGGGVYADDAFHVCSIGS